MSDFYLNLKYEGTILSSFRETVASSRYMEKLNTEGLLGPDNQFRRGSFTMISDGQKTFVGGEGTLFEEFLHFRQLTGYVGEGQPIARVTQNNYPTAEMALVRFDQTFKTMPYDASQRE